MMRSDVPLCSWNSPAPLAGNTRLYFISTDLCPPNSPVDYRIYGQMQEPVYIVWTPVCDTSRCDQWLETALIDTWQAYHKTSSAKQLVNGESDYVQAWGKTSVKLKPALFRANTPHNWLFLEPPTVHREKRVISIGAI